MKYIVIPHFKIKEAQARNSFWLVNSAPIMAAVQAGNAFCFQNKIDPVATHLVYHDATFQGEQFDKHKGYRNKFVPAQKKAAQLINQKDCAGGAGSGGISVSSQPMVNFDGTFSLIFEINDDCSVSEKSIRKFLETFRLAGGTILRVPEAKIFESFEDAIRKIGRGFVIMERQDLMNKKQPLKSMISSLKNKEDGNSWVVPSTLGYRLVSTPNDKENSRNGFPHAWAEPLVGLVQYVSTRKIREESLKPNGWKSKWLNEKTWVISQN